MVDLSKLSADVRNRIETIMAGDGKDSKKIDSRKEYQELGKLLSGDGKVNGKQKEIVEGMLVEYEDTFMVRDEVKQRVADLVKNGDANRADDNAEINDLKKYKKTKGLSKEEKAFIQRVIDGKEVKTENKTPKNEALEIDSKTETPKEASKPEPRIKTETMPYPMPAKNSKEQTTEAVPAQKPTHSPKPGPMGPMPVAVSNKNTSAHQDGKDNINVNGNNNTVIINNEPQTNEAKETQKPETPAPKATQQQLETLANQIFDAIDGIGTKDTQLQNALSEITKDNILELLETYNAKHPDMFAAVLDDLSGIDYTRAVEIFKNALLERGENDSTLARLAGNIDNELESSWRSDETIVNNLHEMARHIRKKEQEA